ncbi:hypothetical protein H6776_01470 [Candidatus Nomurabacteria bacterium]|nr:hypothetical protein [Candidatus Nomurabacteria bacterium]
MPNTSEVPELSWEDLSLQRLKAREDLNKTRKKIHVPLVEDPDNQERLGAQMKQIHHNAQK